MPPKRQAICRPTPQARKKRALRALATDDEWHCNACRVQLVQYKKTCLVGAQIPRCTKCFSCSPPNGNKQFHLNIPLLMWDWNSFGWSTSRAAWTRDQDMLIDWLLVITWLWLWTWPSTSWGTYIRGPSPPGCEEGQIPPPYPCES
jgi:hypothetical protein